MLFVTVWLTERGIDHICKLWSKSRDEWFWEFSTENEKSRNHQYIVLYGSSVSEVEKFLEIRNAID